MKTRSRLKLVAQKSGMKIAYGEEGRVNFKLTTFSP